MFYLSWKDTCCLSCQVLLRPFLTDHVFQTNISVPDDEWYEEWTSEDFMALPELVNLAYENQQYNPKLQYLTGVARDDASYMICKSDRLYLKSLIMYIVRQSSFSNKYWI